MFAKQLNVVFYIISKKFEANCFQSYTLLRVSSQSDNLMKFLIALLHKTHKNAYNASTVNINL